MEKIVRQLFHEHEIDLPIKKAIVSRNGYIDYPDAPTELTLLDKRTYEYWFNKMRNHHSPMKSMQIKAAKVLLDYCQVSSYRRPEWRRNMNKQKRLVFIVNPMAKNGLSLKVWRKIEKNLTTVDYMVFYTTEAGDGSKLAKQVAKEMDDLLLVAVGGDGTIHEVMNGAIGYPNVTFGFIPAGSGNDFAKGIRYSCKSDRVLEPNHPTFKRTWSFIRCWILWKPTW